MDFQVNRPVPLFGRLQLENKILVSFVLVLVVMGVVVLGTVFWTTRQMVREMQIDHARIALAAWSEHIGEVAANGEVETLVGLVERAVSADSKIAYLIFTDAQDRILASAVGSPDHSVFLQDRIATSPGEVPVLSEHSGAYSEESIPVVVGGELVGNLQFAVEQSSGRRFATRASMIAIALTAGPVVLLFLVGRVAVRRTVKPLKELTAVADEISIGHLDPRIDFGVHVNCWELKNCGCTDCEAYMNYTEQCWYIDGTPCEGYESRFPQKLEGCRTCEVYQAHRGDEVVQLADAFKHMANVLKASRQELVNSDDFQKRLIQNSFDGIIATNAEGFITIFNQVAERLTQHPRDEVIGIKRWQELFEEGLEKTMDIPLSHEPVRRLRGFAPKESVIRRANGKWIDVRLSGISLYERGLHIGRVFFFQDMREIKMLRENLIQSERLAAAGQSAAGISHSIKNILDGFNGGVYVYKAGKRRGDEQKMATGWGMIERNVGIISDLVADLLNFAKHRPPDLGLHDPQALIEDVIANTGLRRSDRIQIRVEQTGLKRLVALDWHAFHQCLANLIGNAVEAYPEGRTGIIVAGTEVLEDRAIFTIHDDGVGMSPRTIARIKNGMYSTKGSKGTGLGLQVVQKIVNEHGGVLSIESEEGKGSTFCVEIPNHHLTMTL